MSLQLVFDGNDPTRLCCDDCGASSYFDVSLPALNQMSAFTLGHPCVGYGETSTGLRAGFGSPS